MDCESNSGLHFDGKHLAVNCLRRPWHVSSGALDDNPIAVSSQFIVDLSGPLQVRDVCLLQVVLAFRIITGRFPRHKFLRLGRRLPQKNHQILDGYAVQPVLELPQHMPKIPSRLAESAHARPDVPNWNPRTGP